MRDFFGEQGRTGIFEEAIIKIKSQRLCKMFICKACKPFGMEACLKHVGIPKGEAQHSRWAFNKAVDFSRM
jgi:hypothetical protein